MKQLAAILLLGIFSFNLFGYRLVASFLENQQNEKLELALDENNYTDQQLITIKQPTNLPYYQNSKTFQRIDGEIEIAGIYYKYVKCRIYNDSLEMLCIPNAAKMKIQAAKADFSKQASGFQQPESEKKSSDGSKSFHKAISDFIGHHSTVNTFNIAIPALNYPFHNNIFVSTLFTKSIKRPPKHAVILS